VNIKAKSFYRIAFSALLIIVFSVNAQGKIGYIKDYVYQLTHPLKGPLDFIIPAIKENYAKTDTLILATNYEELSYIYFLDCKVTLGYVNKEYAEDMKLQPDLIVFRKTWGHNPAPYNELIQRAKYKRLAFPVYDSNTNNIAELDFFIKHQFRTKLPANENEKADVFIRLPD